MIHSYIKIFLTILNTGSQLELTHWPLLLQDKYLTNSINIWCITKDILQVSKRFLTDLTSGILLLLQKPYEKKKEANN